MRHHKILSAVVLAGLAGQAAGQVQSGRVEVTFGPFTITPFVGNGAFSVTSPDVGEYNFSGAVPSANGVLLASAADLEEFDVVENGSLV
ncbi:MAG: hypothetical protein AAFO89_01140, partial [Planctomycetota bacterium]